MDLVIRNVRLIDGTGSPPLSSVSLEVSGRSNNLDRRGIGSPETVPAPRGHQRAGLDAGPRPDGLP